ncbi:class I SAM-dependent DNA methyltransferase [Psychromonas ossibalaenae]|uniref:class I SAM-dependent DNA methyltransferase n=1 Tax=Psychromonas ossibalaenae TaxID=444922 RepID=UPI00036671B5|nr:class I SAM-dependent methyltransferase [Psychromonas ossibalaenae]
MTIDHFQHKAENYEQDRNKVNTVGHIANAVLKYLKLDKTMQIMDFGSGTGLLLEKIAPFVGRITAVDISSSMNKILEDKSDNLGCELEILEIDLSKSSLDKKFDRIISSMTMHHIEDIQKMFKNFYSMLSDNGVIAIADLDIEDGSFHTQNTGVYHFGFDRETFLNAAKQAGFKNLNIVSAASAVRPNGEYNIFILTGNK